MRSISIGRPDEATVAHVAPFAVWIVLMLVLPQSAWSYGLRSGATLLVLLMTRPWRWYGRFRGKYAVRACLLGVLVFLVWVCPEWLGARFPAVARFYERFLVFGAKGSANEWSGYHGVSAFAPRVLIRLMGSGFVIAVTEEFFWRGFVYRWIQGGKFTEVDPGRFMFPAFVLTALFFGLEHRRWFVGVLAGVVYGLLLVRTRDIWSSCVAHVTTNVLLGLYVVIGGHGEFWD